MKLVKMILAFTLLLLLSCSISSHAQQKNDMPDVRAMLLTREALSLQNNGYYEEAIDSLKLAIATKPNAVSYYLISHVYNAMQKYDLAIENAEKGIKLDATFKDTYPELYTAYYGAGRWGDAKQISEKAQKANGQSLDDQLTLIDYSLTAEKTSPIFVTILLAVLGIALFYPKLSKHNNANRSSVYVSDYKELLLVNIAVSCLLWFIFYLLAGWIRSFNPKITAADFVIYFRGAIYERDGFESFALYVIMFANMIGSLLLSPVIINFVKTDKYYLPINGVLLAIAAFYFYNIGFLPPVSSLDPTNILVPIVLVVLSIGLYLLYLKSKIAAVIAVVAISSFTGFIALGPPSETDIAYILGPALRLYHGFKISEIYFQYDYYLSFIGWAWMKLNFDLATYAYLGNVSFFLLFIGLFYFADSFFKTKGLSVVFIVGLITVRFYSIWADNPSIFQCTPIRLDLWILPLIIAHKKGIRHWTVGLMLGLLVIFHRNLGLIYSGAYAEILAILLFADIYDNYKKTATERQSIAAILTNHVKMGVINVAILIASVGMCFVLFHEFFSPSAIMYRKLGVNMMQIAKTSFYWYVPIILSGVFVLLFRFKKQLGIQYFNTGLFVVLLTTGNSMYFFGRSHENNILNISGVLILSLYVLFDLLLMHNADSKQKTEQAIPANNKSKMPAIAQPNVLQQLTIMALPLASTALLGYCYAPRIAEKVNLQKDNLAANELIQPFRNMPVDIPAVRSLTNNSNKVYFLNFNFDLYHYYYGGYVPQGYFSPCPTWVYRKDFINFMSDLVDKGYYIVCNAREGNRYNDFFPYLHANQNKQKNDCIAFSKQATPLLFSEQTKPLMHYGIQDTLAPIGLDVPPVTTATDFTIQLLLKPAAQQTPNATILNNFDQDGPVKGFTLQQNIGNVGAYVFGYSNGTNITPNAIFPLAPEQWHYLVITLAKEELKIYDNGSLIVSSNPGPLPYANSDKRITIGNQLTRDCSFNGAIREVCITNGIITTNEMMQNIQTIQKSLPNLH